MGIQGLLPLLKSIQKPVSIGADFRGQVIGVDVYCWLHKGAYGCAMELVEGKKSSMYVNYVLKRVEMLLHFNVKPILVFDGSYLPSKSGQEAQRRKTRQENKAKGLAFLRVGNRQQAFECFQKCIDITPDMALEVIKECRKKGVDCVVAPYEADAQLAYLMKSGITQATISEDSDLLVYGCQKVIFKMDACGHGIAVDLADLSKLTSLKLHEFTQEKFRHMCILSGCDYLPSIKGVGLHKAIKLLRKSSCVYKLIRSLRLDGKMQIPADYEKKFKQANETFLYQLVFDPVTSTLVPLTQLPDGIKPGDLEFAGPLMSQEKALGIALGNINPISGEMMADFNPKRTSVFTVGVPGEVCPSAENSDARALTPVPSSSWGHSVLSKRGKTEYDVQKNLSGLMLNSQPSAKSKRPFVPPGQKRKISEDSVDDESLTSMYTSLKTRPTPTHRHTTVARVQEKKSRFKNPFRVNGQETEPTDSGEHSRYFNLVGSPESESKRSLMESVKPIECSSKLGQVLIGGDNEEEQSDRAMGGLSGHNVVVGERSASVSAAMDPDCTSDEEQNTENEHRIVESEHRATARERRLSAAMASEDCTNDKEQNKENEHKMVDSTSDSTDHITVQDAQSLDPRRQSLRRVACSTRDQAKPQSALTNRSLNTSGTRPVKTPQTNLCDRFGYKSSLNSAKGKQDDKHKLEVIDIDGGYLSDDENSTDCGTPTPTTPLPSFTRLTPPLSEQNSTRQLSKPGSTVGTKTMKNQIQLKAKAGGRSSGLGRCRSLGVTRKKSKHDSSNSAASSTLFSYFEFERRKKPRLEEDQFESSNR